MNDEINETRALEAGVEVKRCAKCGRILPITEFNKEADARDGLQCYCKECTKEAQRSIKSKKLLNDYLVPTKPDIPEELANKHVSQCKPRELMAVLKLWGYDGELTWTQKISLSDI